MAQSDVSEGMPSRSLLPLFYVALVPQLTVAQDVPRAVMLQEVGAQNISTTTFDCTPPANAKTTCTFVGTFVRKPTPEALKEKLTQYDSPVFRKEVATNLPKCKRALDEWRALLQTPEATAAKKSVARMLIDACIKQDVDLFVAAYKYSATEIEAHTCTVLTTYAKSAVFTQTGPNSWQSIDGGPLGGTVVDTLWREPKRAVWNLRSVRAGDVSCEQGQPLCREAGVVEWRVDARRPPLEGCKYVEAE